MCKNSFNYVFFSAYFLKIVKIQNNDYHQKNVRGSIDDKMGEDKKKYIADTEN